MLKYNFREWHAIYKNFIFFSRSKIFFGSMLKYKDTLYFRGISFIFNFAG